MNNNIDERILEEVKYFLTHENATIRTTAKEFGVSKSTVYIDLTTRLEPYILLYPKVKEKNWIKIKRKEHGVEEKPKNKNI